MRSPSTDAARAADPLCPYARAGDRCCEKVNAGKCSPVRGWKLTSVRFCSNAGTGARGCRAARVGIQSRRHTVGLLTTPDQHFRRVRFTANDVSAQMARRRPRMDVRGQLPRPFPADHLLLDLLRRSAPARIVNVSSVGHRQGTIDFDNRQFEHGGYKIMRAYGHSKLAPILFTR